MSDVNHVLQIELLDEFPQIIGIGIHVVPLPGLVGATMPATVMSNDAISAGGEEKHLILECVGAQRPTVAENDRLTLAPVFIVNLRPFLGGAHTHGKIPFLAAVKIFEIRFRRDPSVRVLVMSHHHQTASDTSEGVLPETSGAKQLKCRFRWLHW